MMGTVQISTLAKPPQRRCLPSDETDLPQKKRKMASTAEQDQPPPKKRNTSPTPEPEGTSKEQALGSNGQGGDSESERAVEEDLRASMSAKTVTEKEGTPEHFQG